MTTLFLHPGMIDLQSAHDFHKSDATQSYVQSKERCVGTTSGEFMAVSFINVCIKHQSSFGMLYINSGLTSKVIIGRSFYLTHHAFIRSNLETPVRGKSFFYHCKKEKGGHVMT